MKLSLSQASAILTLTILTAANPVFASETSTPIVKMLWVATNRIATTKLMKSEFESSVYGFRDFQMIPRLLTTSAPINPHGKPNPFAISDEDFNTASFLVPKGETRGAPPLVDPADAGWFQQQVDKGNLPDVFLIGGHHVISQGWHSHEEDKFLYAPTFLQTLKNYPAAKQMFDHVKLAILWGCNTMTNLEPHGPNGEYLSSEQIRATYFSGPAGRISMIGTSKSNNTLEFYKSRLAREYGPSSAKYEYTRSASAERCKGPGRYQNCSVTNLERVMPEDFLYDGTHMYNEPAKMKKIFPNAYLVLGYSSASPSEETRAAILKLAIDRTRNALNKNLTPDHPNYVKNPLYLITATDTPKEIRIRVIEELRKQWTITTNEKNRARPSGSITPAYPELDQNGIFNVVVSDKTPAYAPYEQR